MFELLRRDLQRYFVFESRTGKPGLFEKAKILLESHGLQGVAVYRFGSWINRSVKRRALKVPLKLAYVALNEVVMTAWGIHIHGEAEIGGGLLIPHPLGVLVGAVKMGEDCMLGQNVTIGVRPGIVRESPTVGDRVFFGPGAVAFGKIVIADGACVGPLTVVGRNLPPRCLAVGNPMQIVKRDFDNTELIYGDRPPEASSPPVPLRRRGG